jgi:hypothetical protein
LVQPLLLLDVALAILLRRRRRRLNKSKTQRLLGEEHVCFVVRLTIAAATAPSIVGRRRRADMERKIGGRGGCSHCKMLLHF